MADTFVPLVGNLIDDPELRFTQGGRAVANFRLAVTPRVREGDTWRDGETAYYRIVVWGTQAEHVTDSLGKGARAVVVGRLRMHAWETPDGDKRSVLEVDADEVGPSLRWAIARPQKASKGTAAAGQFNDEPSF